MNSDDQRLARRQFLQYLASSPLVAAGASVASLGALLEFLPERVLAQSYDVLRAPTTSLANGIIVSPDQALNVMDFEPAARAALVDSGAPAHFGYLATGVDDDATLRANREGFSRFQIRPRRLVDVSNVDTSIQLLGSTWKSPIALAPAGSQRAFHPDGEMAAARAAGAKGQLMILSTGATASVEDVRAAHGGQIWFQLYPTDTWRITQALVKRAEAAGCPVLVLTVDLPAGRNTETERRFARPSWIQRG